MIFVYTPTTKAPGVPTGVGVTEPGQSGSRRVGRNGSPGRGCRRADREAAAAESETRRCDTTGLRETCRRDHRGQVAVRRRDDANIDANRLRAADPLDVAILQHAQKADLGVERQLADFVEEQRAAVGPLEPTLAGFRGAGEGAPLVAEELRVDQLAGNGAAIDADERPAGRSLRLWIARATTSLPVPVSPKISTGTSDRLTKSTRCMTGARPALSPTIVSLSRCGRVGEGATGGRPRRLRGGLPTRAGGHHCPGRRPSALEPTLVAIRAAD